MVEQIWEGEDYTKIVYDQWVRSEKDPFYGLWIDDKLVGIGRMTRLTDYDIWLEGLKKDPDCQIRGIGRRFVDFFFDMLRHEGNPRSIRFSTYFANTESIRLNTNIGFRQTHTFSNLTYEIETRQDVEADVERYEGDSKDLLGVFKRSSFFRAMDGFITQGWVFYPASDEMLRQFIRKGHIFTAQSGSGIEGAILLSESPKEHSLSVVSIAAEDEGMLERLLRAALQYAWQNGIEHLTMMCPEYPEYLKWLKSFGFASWDRERDVYLYEYPIERL